MSQSQATLKPHNGLSGFGERTMALELYDKTLAYFGIQNGEPVMHMPAVNKMAEVEIVIHYWRQYCAACQRSTKDCLQSERTHESVEGHTGH